MKNLTLLNDNTNIKLNDTGTVIQFKASNEGQPVGLSNGQSATFRIKNELGFLKSVTASTSYGGYVFELDTEDLKGLVPDTYQVELLIQVDSDNALIFPDKGFVQFSINANALNITGEQLPVMSLDDFKDELKTYVTNQTTQATSNIKNDFDTYVDNLTDSTVATATKASQDAQTAINTANTAKNTADTAKSTADTAKSTADSATTKANNAQSTADTANNKATANASLILSINSLIESLQNATPNRFSGTSYVPQTFTGSGKMLINTTNSPYTYVSLNDLNVIVGQTYTFSIYIENPTVNFRYKVECYDDNNGWKGGFYGNVINAAESGYSTVTFEIPSETTKILHFAMPENLNAPENTTVSLSQENLVLGNVRLPWTPNPMDFVTKS